MEVICLQIVGDSLQTSHWPQPRQPEGHLLILEAEVEVEFLDVDVVIVWCLHYVCGWKDVDGLDRGDLYNSKSLYFKM